LATLSKRWVGSASVCGEDALGESGSLTWAWT
jgi:hypothetical protein